MTKVMKKNVNKKNVVGISRCYKKNNYMCPTGMIPIFYDFKVDNNNHNKRK